MVIGTIGLYQVPATFWSSMSLCENINDDIELEVVLEKTLMDQSPINQNFELNKSRQKF